MPALEERILGIETSCDETAAAVVAGGRRILSNVVASQTDIHRKFGGVVPEIASREHLRQIVPVVREAMERAGMAFADLDAIAVTKGPGLIGALLVGVTYGKALAMALGKPLIGVNHLAGHVHAVLLDAHAAGRTPEFPAICLIVSGGHTLLYHVTLQGANGVQHLSYTRIGSTRDDAAGEAYDKVARMLELGYPGGPVIDRLASRGNPRAITFGEPKMSGNALDFSFSGIKTAVLYHLRRNPQMQPEIETRRAALGNVAVSAEAFAQMCSAATLDLVSSFQRGVVNNLTSRTFAAAEEKAARTILLSGGVAANSELRKTFETEAERRAIKVYFPTRGLCTDNAAMIAAAAHDQFLAGQHADTTLEAEANLALA